MCLAVSLEKALLCLPCGPASRACGRYRGYRASDELADTRPSCSRTEMQNTVTLAIDDDDCDIDFEWVALTVPHPVLVWLEAGVPPCPAARG